MSVSVVQTISQITASGCKSRRHPSLIPASTRTQHNVYSRRRTPSLTSCVVVDIKCIMLYSGDHMLSRFSALRTSVKWRPGCSPRPLNFKGLIDGGSRVSGFPPSPPFRRRLATSTGWSMKPVNSHKTVLYFLVCETDIRFISGCKCRISGWREKPDLTSLVSSL